MTAQADKRTPRQQAHARTAAPRQSLQTRLLAAARAAIQQAYAPYSNFPVGAALLAEDERIFTGANLENASYGLTLCAERAAVVQAVHAGARQFLALAIVVQARAPVAPCGACRQVLAEFCKPEIPIFCGTVSGRSVIRTTVGRLLPNAFHLKGAGVHALKQTPAKHGKHP